MLADYNRAFPGCAERIVVMAEGQSRHRQALESSNLAHNQALARRAQWIGGALAFVIILGGLGLAFWDKPVTGLTVIAAAVVSILGVAWYGKKSQREELEAKAKALEATIPQVRPGPQTGTGSH